jgi:mono/diheme cytochrome c family protein
MFRFLILILLTKGFLFAKNPSFEAFLDTHCVSCHGPKKEKGDLRIDTLSRDFKNGIDSHLWAEVVERINAGEMPPEEEPRPSEKEISTFIAQLDQKLSEGKAARMAAP